MQTTYSEQIQTLQKLMRKETDANTYEALNDAASTIATLRNLRVSDLSKLCINNSSIKSDTLTKLWVFTFGLVSGIGSVAFYISIF